MRRPRLWFALATALAITGGQPAMGAATTPRADTYYEIWCTTADGEVYLAKRVDAAAIQPEKDPGGKDTATDQYNANNPFGEHCEAVGPIGS